MLETASPPQLGKLVKILFSSNIKSLIITQSKVPFEEPGSNSSNVNLEFLLLEEFYRAQKEGT